MVAAEGEAEMEKRTHADSVTAEDFGGYENPYAITIDIELERRKLNAEVLESIFKEYGTAEARETPSK